MPLLINSRGCGEAHVQSTAMRRPRPQAVRAHDASHFPFRISAWPSPGALGSGATVGILGTGVPRLACLRPVAWLKGRPAWPIFISTSSRPS